MRRALVITFCGLGLLVPAGALAAGGPVPPLAGGAGVSATGNPFNFVAFAAGGNTLVERVTRDGGAVERYRLLPGSFGVPGVAYDGSSTGLSADGRTLVLAGNSRSYPPTRTRLLVLDTVRFRTHARIALAGSFTVDAISPTGRWLYLTHYRSPSSTNDYEVRAYDLADRRLLAKPVVDPREPDEKMQGLPVTRTMSADGRWAYTLYSRGEAAPFIHALDTARRVAFCVDFPALRGTDISSARLALTHGGTTLRIGRADAPLALMDTGTFAVRTAPTPPLSPTSAPGGHSASPLWLLGIVPLAALVALGLLARRRRRARAAPA